MKIKLKNKSLILLLAIIRTSLSQIDEKSSQRFASSDKIIEKLVEDQILIYRQKVQPYKDVDIHAEDFVGDLESSHEYFRNFAKLKLEIQLDSFQVDKEIYSSKLLYKIETDHENYIDKMGPLIAQRRNKIIGTDESSRSSATSKDSQEFHISLIADLDAESRDENNLFKSFQKSAMLLKKSSEGKFEFHWTDVEKIQSGFSYKGFYEKTPV